MPYHISIPLSEHPILDDVQNERSKVFKEMKEVGNLHITLISLGNAFTKAEKHLIKNTVDIVRRRHLEIQFTISKEARFNASNTLGALAIESRNALEALQRDLYDAIIFVFKAAMVPEHKIRAVSMISPYIFLANSAMLRIENKDNKESDKETKNGDESAKIDKEKVDPSKAEAAKQDANESAKSEEESEKSVDTIAFSKKDIISFHKIAKAIGKKKYPPFNTVVFFNPQDKPVILDLDETITLKTALKEDPKIIKYKAKAKAEARAAAENKNNSEQPATENGSNPEAIESQEGYAAAIISIKKVSDHNGEHHRENQDDPMNFDTMDRLETSVKEEEESSLQPAIFKLRSKSTPNAEDSLDLENPKAQSSGQNSAQKNNAQSTPLERAVSTPPLLSAKPVQISRVEARPQFNPNNKLNPILEVQKAFIKKKLANHAKKNKPQVEQASKVEQNSQLAGKKPEANKKPEETKNLEAAKKPENAKSSEHATAPSFYLDTTSNSTDATLISEPIKPNSAATAPSFYVAQRPAVNNSTGSSVSTVAVPVMFSNAAPAKQPAKQPIKQPVKEIGQQKPPVSSNNSAINASDTHLIKANFRDPSTKAKKPAIPAITFSIEKSNNAPMGVNSQGVSSQAVNSHVVVPRNAATPLRLSVSQQNVITNNSPVMPQTPLISQTQGVSQTQGATQTAASQTQNAQRSPAKLSLQDLLRNMDSAGQEMNQVLNRSKSSSNVSSNPPNV